MKTNGTIEKVNKGLTFVHLVIAILISLVGIGITYGELKKEVEVLEDKVLEQKDERKLLQSKLEKIQRQNYELQLNLRSLMKASNVPYEVITGE